MCTHNIVLFLVTVEFGIEALQALCSITTDKVFDHGVGYLGCGI